MKLSWNWLSDYVDLTDITTEELVNRLTLSACEVEGVEAIYEHLEKIVIARILEKTPHPNADRLALCRVTTGKKQYEIVCGASNVREGALAPLATVGVRLPTADGGYREIEKTTIRGVESLGMLCSPQELLLEKFTGNIDGLLLLDELSPTTLAHPPRVGGRLSDCFPIKDIIFEIDNKSITHRPDLWSHFGFAREIAAIFTKKIIYNPLLSAPAPTYKKLPTKSIWIEKGAAKAYYGRYCDGVKVVPSPLWMRARLESVGQRPINNVVDASNYLLFEAGQPNHAFDARNLKSDAIAVATNGVSLQIENFTTLDGEQRNIPNGTILILDGLPAKSQKQGPDSPQPVALGGVMGGLLSSVSDDTDALFLESAVFPREKIRQTLSSVPLRTESAVRFEKGQDPANARPALARLTELLRETCPELGVGRVSGSAPEPAQKNKIKITLSFIQKRLGFPIPRRQVQNILERLQFQIKLHVTKSETRFTITVPTYRSQYDVTIPEDIVEELGRIYGYDNIHPVAPPFIAEATPINRERLFERQAKEFFIHKGDYNETMNYSFAFPADNALFQYPGLKLKNPSFVDRNELRLSLIPGLMRQGVLNQDRFNDVKLFELGRIHFRDPGSEPEELSSEKKRLSALHIPPVEKTGHVPEDGGYIFTNYLKLRSQIESFLEKFIPRQFQLRVFDPEADDKKGVTLTPFLHPRCAVELVDHDGARLGVFGILNPLLEKKYDLKRAALVMDLYFDDIFSIHNRIRLESRYQLPSIFPDSFFEFTIVMDEQDSTQKPVEFIHDLKLAEVRHVSLLSIYRGEPLTAGKKAVSYNVRCAKENGTLDGKRLQELLGLIVEHLRTKNLPLRGT